jgi:hypothetical protein
MNDAMHLTTEEMVRALDRDLAGSEQARVETHLAQCEECLNKYEQLAAFSGEFKHGLESVTVDVPPTARRELEAAFGTPQVKALARGQRIGKWIAAAAAIAVMFVAASKLWVRNEGPQSARIVQTQAPEKSSATAEEPVRRAEETSRVEASPTVKAAEGREPVKRATRVHPASFQPRFTDGFVPLPYSDPSLPVTSADMVRVEMRLSALTTAGIVRAQPLSDDPLVEADVLLGQDGQPSAIRVLHTSFGK